MRIAFFDIDGTLATGTKVPQSAADALARMRAKGDLVFICTGRARAYVEANFSQYADGFVCNNGRMAFMGDRTLVDKQLSAQQIAHITKALDGVGAGYAFFEVHDAYFGGPEKYRETAEQVLKLGHLPCIEDPAALHAYNFDIYFDDAAHRQRATEALGDMCLVNPHGPHPSADVTVIGAGKGDAVRDVAAALGVDIKDTYAFGDGINDLSMIQAAGHGIAMGNAVDELKQAAEYVTADIDQDGVAQAMEHFGLA
ncbi:MAG: Cof-type HAD-IIB family hydrolase [Atopobiaceae bacterium]|nr:Cof-type HAD-IIB family hydrolase [Atopobiaceae bacterium]